MIGVIDENFGVLVALKNAATSSSGVAGEDGKELLGGDVSAR